MEYKHNCRCCLNSFDVEDTQIRITPIVQQRFEELTSVELLMRDSLSQFICEKCNSGLKGFTQFRKELVYKQQNILYESLAVVVEASEPTDYSEAASFDEAFDASSIKHEAEVDVKIKLEPEYMSPEYLYEYEHQVEETQQTEEVPVIKKSAKVYKKAICPICHSSYYKDQLKRHIDKVHLKKKRFFCDICGFGSFLKCNLATHMAKHVAKEFRPQILCALCPAVFTRIESLKNHQKTEHDSNPVLLQCFCGKEFNLRHKLTTHIKRTHQNQRDHSCNMCSKQFFTPKELKVHILKCHTPGFVDSTQHFCHICGKKYSSSKSLRTHMKHHALPEFTCSFDGCQKGFITKLLLTNHEKIHLGQRDFICHLCPKSFFSANHLRRHILVTHEKVRIACFIENCRFSVGRKDYLRNHIILSHRELSESVKNEYLIRIRDMKLP